MTERLKSLNRIAAVQKQMVRLSEWQLAAADRSCRELEADRARLQSYVVDEGALGVPLAKAALRSLHRLDDRQIEAERRRETSRVALDRAKRREKAVDELEGAAMRAARRIEEDRALAATLEVWLASRAASLP